jgi:hypothetical protein
MWSLDRNWTSKIHWETPAGIALQKLIACLPKENPIQLFVFGSSPLQLGLEPSFLSADVDLFSNEDLSAYIRLAGLEKGKAEVYIEQTPANVFLASPAWTGRAFRAEFGNVVVMLAHPIDVLVGKIKRLEAKDLNAYKLVYSLTGHPLESEMIKALQEIVDVYRPAFDEEDTGGDPWGNTVKVWEELYGKSVDVRSQIVAPALVRRREAYGLNAEKSKNALRDISSENDLRSIQ